MAISKTEYRSLGQYGRTELKLESPTADGFVADDGTVTRDAFEKLGPENLRQVTDVFDLDGQNCDETGTGRRTRVNFKCCTPTDLKKPKPPLQPVKPVAEMAHLVSIKETETCNYQVTVSSLSSRNSKRYARRRSARRPWPT